MGSEEQRHARAALAEPLLSKDIVSQQIGHADRILWENGVRRGLPKTKRVFQRGLVNRFAGMSAV
jgi:hypothetical protein